MLRGTGRRWHQIGEMIRILQWIWVTSLNATLPGNFLTV